MSLAIDTSHGCADGGAVAAGLVPVQRKASSACCSALLDLADDGSFTCQNCGKATTRVLAHPVAHWTCTCGQRRSQVITTPTEG